MFITYPKPIAREESKIPISHSQTILDPQIVHWDNLAFLYLSNKLIPVKGFFFSNLNLVNVVTSNNNIFTMRFNFMEPMCQQPNNSSSKKRCL
jgi:hypothetical protein